MTDGIADTLDRDPARVADTALKAAAGLWYVVALIGLWIFVYFIVVFYGVSAFEADLGASNLSKRYIDGETFGNLTVAAHILLAVYIIGFGPLQLIPWIRNHFPALHRWNGRIYIPTVITSSLAGLYIVWFRNIDPADIQDFGLSLDAILIIIFAAIALRYALARDFVTHRRWALRLFLVVIAVWFFRISVFGWIFLADGVGIDFETFTGPFLSFLTFGQYLVPLAVLELYFLAQDRAGSRGKFAMAGGLFGMTVLMGIGIFTVTTMSWLPRL